MERVAAADGSVGSRLVPAENVIPGDDVHYTITFVNEGKAAADAGSVVITEPGAGEHAVHRRLGVRLRNHRSVLRRRRQDVPSRQRTHRGARRRKGAGSPRRTTRRIRWVFAPALAPAAQSYVSFNARLQ